MDRPPLERHTTAAVEAIPTFGLDGGIVVVVMIKERFALDARGRTKRLGDAEIRLADEPWDDAPQSSIRYPADLSLRRPSTDVVVVGYATAPGGRAVRELDVLVRVGPLEKVLRVFGTRTWYRGATGLTLTKPEPFELVPLRWELAWGGFDTSDPKHPIEEPRNPVGRGLVRESGTLVHQPGPQIEDPSDLVRSHRSRPVPAGVGAIGRHWEPRRAFAGTYDERWKKERMPLLPLDFDERHAQVATPALIAPHPLVGGEPVQLLHLSRDGAIETRLPRLAFYVGARTDDGHSEHKPMLDMVLLEPAERMIEMTWRAIVPWRRPYASLHYVQVYEKEIVS